LTQGYPQDARSIVDEQLQGHGGQGGETWV
jgi:hypothetical protein